MRRTAVLLLLILPGMTAGPAAAEETYPERKAGQWEIALEMAGAPAMTMQMCIDAATDRMLQESGTATPGSQCANTDARQENGSYIVESVCTINGARTRSRAVMTGDFDSAYTVDITSTTEGGDTGMPPHSTLRQVATWKGACPAGMAPGDMVMPGGMKINVPAMMKQVGG